LQGLDCAACAAKIEAAVARETGLTGVGVDFATRSMYLPPEHAAAVQQIIDRIEPGVRLVEAASWSAPAGAGCGAAPSIERYGAPHVPAAGGGLGRGGHPGAGGGQGRRRRGGGGARGGVVAV